MPPPMSPQGSRAGLITAVVVLSILFVTSAIFAFYYNAEYRRADAAQKQLTDRNNQFASSAFQQDPAYQAVDALRTNPAHAGKSIAEILVAQRNEADRALANQADHAAAMTRYQAALAAAQHEEVLKADINVGKNVSLADAVQKLVTGVRTIAARNQQLTGEVTAAKEQYEQELAQRKVVLAERDEKLTEQGKQLEAALAELGIGGAAGDESVARIQGEADRALKEAQAELSAQQKLVADRNEQVGKLQKDLEAALIKIRQMRPPGTKENVVRQADGEVVRIPGNDNVFINLGQGDQVSPGLTFEVYDRFAGVPALGPDGGTGNPDEDETSLPRGKASIEVVRVMTGQSECRIIRTTPGQNLVERDVIANLVYDRNTKYNFVVFGDFDLDRNGAPTPGDGDVIRRLITQWGGQLQNAVNVNTDFVVLGAVPEVPTESEDDTATDIARREAAQKALDAYDEVRSQAIALNIPIMNQSRFLYYIGYFELSQR